METTPSTPIDKGMLDKSPSDPNTTASSRLGVEKLSYPITDFYPGANVDRIGADVATIRSHFAENVRQWQQEPLQDFHDVHYGLSTNVSTATQKTENLMATIQSLRAVLHDPQAPFVADHCLHAKEPNPTDPNSKASQALAPNIVPVQRQVWVVLVLLIPPKEFTMKDIFLMQQPAQPPKLTQMASRSSVFMEEEAGSRWRV
ncbi:hypothetical protein F0562_032278 [Nyssa sinensis]|uniref:Uncharacterized protein n=1 Tax=Nyssa sinensis TaxID=561372 RepID=A0A5J5AMC0_9ASTE|nr:hypothetical protein F0562_032278 [Nyssa sinensis]